MKVDVLELIERTGAYLTWRGVVAYVNPLATEDLYTILTNKEAVMRTLMENPSHRYYGIKAWEKLIESYIGSNGKLISVSDKEKNLFSLWQEGGIQITDPNLKDWLARHKNMQEYVESLIREDMERHHEQEIDLYAIPDECYWEYLDKWYREHDMITDINAFDAPDPEDEYDDPWLRTKFLYDKLRKIKKG